ncbi:biotin-dependent carboxyltransferase family protein [Jeotgalibacillus sp. S-D1]|uniref:5-oxoprolinase subunit C family protein n=1 Tax=Jeotgalibacillus sp. S-D1 TaxID=2552189 RepID=UPI001059B51F|nr:biotin-dependent carboxyltransferase family protein [Jeotgalibacillus sp. S-D1]TDL31762.1 biotin-dependent carboxyltransferase family protein [Jeotgalibacillus sp. S-D1]
MIRVIEPGLLSTIQDEGRNGFQQYGVIASGVMDTFAYRIANILVGNEEREAVIEVTLTGPTLEFEKDGLIAICGADFSAQLDGEPCPTWRPVFVKQGTTLHMKFSKKGCRAVIAVGGGLDLPIVMNSKSTYLRAQIGGLNGRTLDKEDVIQNNPLSQKSKQIILSLTKKVGKSFTSRWSISKVYLHEIYYGSSLRVMKGRQYDEFAPDSQQDFWEKPFKVSPQSDRMGFRLDGTELKRTVSEDLLSEAVAFGTIQVPADGQAIILLADRQTIGGYPKIGQVSSVDLPALVQKKPGETIHFKEISHEEAQCSLLKREQDIRELKWIIDRKIESGGDNHAAG